MANVGYIRVSSHGQNDVVKGFVTRQLSRFLPAHQLPFEIVGTHISQV